MICSKIHSTKSLNRSTQQGKCIKYRGDIVHRSFDLELLLAVEPGESEVQQLLHGTTLMVPRHLLMQVPPHPFDRVVVRAAARQKVQLNSVLMIPQVGHHLLAAVKLRIVADDVDLLVPSQPMAQVVQVGQEQSRIPPLLRLALGEENLTAAPVDRAGKVALLVSPRGLDLGLLTLEHPHRADLGVGIDVDLVLEDSRFVLRQSGHELPQFSQLDPPLLLVRLHRRAGPTIDHAALMQPPTDGLATDVEVITPQHQEGDDFTAPTAAEETKVPRDFATDQVDDDGHPCGTEAAGAARLMPGHGFHSFLMEPFDPSINGSGAAEQERCDSQPGVTIGQQQEDVGAEANLGVGVLAISIEQRLALPGVEGHATSHGCKYQRCELSCSTQLYRPRLLSLLRGSI